MRLTLTGRSSTVSSLLTTNTYWPCWLVWTAAAGTTTRFGSSPRITVKLTNWPGQRVSSSLGKVALSITVPVASSTLLSTKERVPFASGAVLSGIVAVTETGLEFFLSTLGRSWAGTEKLA